MLAIRSIILDFVLFCRKTSKKFLLTFERKKSRTSRDLFYLKMFKRHKISVAHDFNARAIIDSETERFTEEPIHEYLVQCRFHSSHVEHTLYINEY